MGAMKENEDSGENGKAHQPCLLNTNIVDKMVGLWLSHRSWEIYRSFVSRSYVHTHVSVMKKRYYSQDKARKLPACPEVWLEEAIRNRVITMADFVSGVALYFANREVLEKELCEDALYEGWSGTLEGVGFTEAARGPVLYRRHQQCPGCTCPSIVPRTGRSVTWSTWEW
jgi:hypothetical protein